MKAKTRLIVLSGTVSITLSAIMVYSYTLPTVSSKQEQALATDHPTSNVPQNDLQSNMIKTNESIPGKDVPDQPSSSSKSSQNSKVIPTYDQWVSVNEGVNVRSEPSLNATIVMKTFSQSLFPFVKQNGKWDLVQVGMNQTAWIADTEVHKQPNTNQIQVMKVNPNTELQEGPDQAFATVGEASPNDSYIPMQVSGQWVHLLSKDTGQSSWAAVNAVQWKAAQNTSQVLSEKPANHRLQGKTIVIDPGHGGKDTGTIGTQKQIYERDVNLAVANLLADKLKVEGANVILTRQTNDTFVSLTDRAKISNDNHADAFISIHQNSYPKDPSVSGTKVYYYDAKTSESLAKTIEQAVNATEHDKKSDNEMNQEELAVLHHNDEPAVLLEGCFLSNPKELNESVTPKWEDELASGIFHGLLNYFGQNTKNEAIKSKDSVSSN